VITAPCIQKGDYSIAVKYYSAGPMGTSRGVVVIHQSISSNYHITFATPTTLEPAVPGLPLVIPFSLLSRGEVQQLATLHV
jgi:hypothetical protein